MGRGPSYPYIGLEEAIGMTRKMYDFAKRAPAQTDAVVTEAWKLSTTSSGSHKILAALRAFGLIEDVPKTNGKSIKISQRAIHILLETEDTPEKRGEIRKAALAPKWYEFCWKTWGKEMPPSMRSNLLIEHGFVDSTIEDFLKNYRKSIAFAGLLDDTIFGKNDEEEEKSENSFKVGDYVQWEIKGILQMSEAKKIASFLDNGRYALVEGSTAPVPVAQLIAADPPEAISTTQTIQIPVIAKQSVPGEKIMQAETIALADGLTLQVQYPSIITQDAYDDFLYQLEGFKKRLGRIIKKADTPNDQTDPAS
jgi:hypothetical protein